MLRVAIGTDVLPGRDRAELGRRAVLVGAADEQHLVAELAAEARMHVGGQQRAREIAEMLDAIDVGKRTGDQNLRHDTCPSQGDAPDPKNKKALPRWRKGSGSRRMPRANG